VRPPGRIASGSIQFDGNELVGRSRKEMRRLRGRDIAITLQDALTALNPSMTVGNQILEVLREHRGREGKAALKRRALEMLALLGIPEPDRRFNQFPHEFSGGMRQRVMMAIALACGPKLLIADEPTSALDVTVQAQVLDHLMALRRKLGMTIVLITHDLALVAEYCDRVVVMYAGQVAECGPTASVIGNPAHPYTRGLLDSIPDLSRPERPIRPIEGRVPILLDLPPECRFLGRCARAEARCRNVIEMRDLEAGHQARCVLAEAPR
jgi:oligopeptide/dipeptide ABC transporter ATP-binding protein